MDIDALKKDALETLELIPPEIIGTLVQLGTRYYAQVSADVPRIVALMKPHVRAIALESAAGLISKDEAEIIGKEIISAYFARLMARREAAMKEATPHPEPEGDPS